MRRRLFMLAAALSLLLGVASASLWARGRVYPGCFFWSSFADAGRYIFWNRTILFVNGSGWTIRRQVSPYHDRGPAAAAGAGPTSGPYVRNDNLLYFDWLPSQVPNVPDYPEFKITTPSRATITKLGLAGFRRTHFASGPVDSVEWVVPLWFTFLPALLVCGTCARRWQTRRRTRRLAGRRCPTCNYDLQCNTSGVCPECGIAPSKLGRGG